METKIFRSAGELPAAAAIVKLGGLVAVPTETVYGLCVNGLDSAAVAALYEAKGRPEVKPLSLMVSRPADIARYCRDVPRAAYTLAARFWPGPLTIVLPAQSVVPSIVRAGGDTVGLRCPAHELTLELLRQARLPLAGPSANPSGKPSPKTAAEVLAYFDGKIDAVIDGGRCGIGTESTILDMSAAPFRILRRGALGEDAVGAALRAGITLVGITGGTGSGKTTALETLRDRGALVIDCDEVYHRLLDESAALRDALAVRFGEAFSAGALDRKKLGALAFADPEALRDLNTITHRFVSAEVERLLLDWAWQGGELAAVDAIALFESGLAAKCAFTVGITADPETRARRIVERENIPADYARLRIAAQKSDDYFAEHSDYVLENNGSREEFAEKCRQLFGTVLQGGN